MKKLNRTYVMGVFCLLLAAFIAWQTTMIPEKLVTNEPGPRLFPYISAVGIAFFAILSMIFDGPKDRGRDYLDKAGWIRLIVIIGECILFVAGMYFIGFWITSMLGMMMFIYTLKGDKKINLAVALILSIGLGTICYFGFSKGFVIPLPKGVIWDALGIAMP